MIGLRPLFELAADVAAPQVTPEGPYGTRRFIPVTGGSFRGERIAGRLLPGGADCQLIRPDGAWPSSTCASRCRPRTAR